MQLMSWFSRLFGCREASICSISRPPGPVECRPQPLWLGSGSRYWWPVSLSRKLQKIPDCNCIIIRRTNGGNCSSSPVVTFSIRRSPLCALSPGPSRRHLMSSSPGKDAAIRRATSSGRKLSIATCSYGSAFTNCSYYCSASASILSRVKKWKSDVSVVIGMQNSPRIQLSWYTSTRLGTEGEIMPP